MGLPLPAGSLRGLPTSCWVEEVVAEDDGTVFSCTCLMYGCDAELDCVDVVAVADDDCADVPCPLFCQAAPFELDCA